ncbi:TP53-binding protein 1 isoform X1 [Biomphalaria glabrata]
MEKLTLTQSDSFTESSVDFLISNSDVEDLDSLPSWDLMTGLPALKQGKSKPEMTSEKDLNPFLSASDLESDTGCIILAKDTVDSVLVPDTVSGSSSTHSYVESNNNTTALERTHYNAGKSAVSPVSNVVDCHSQPMLSMIDSLPYKTIPDSPVMDVYDSDVSEADIFMKEKTPDREDSPIRNSYNEFKKGSFGESQSFHLKLTPSLTEDYDVDDVNQNEKHDEAIAASTVTSTSPFKLKVQNPPLEFDSVATKPLFSIQKPTILDEEVDSLEESESSISVFKKVKTGSTSPKKKKKLGDDSVEFLPQSKSQRRISNVEIKSEKQLTTESSKSPYFSKSKNKIISDLPDSSEKLVKKSDKMSNKSAIIEENQISAPEPILILSQSDSSIVDLTLSYNYQEPAQTVDYRSNESLDTQSDKNKKNDHFSSPDFFINPSQKRLPTSDKALDINSEEGNSCLMIFENKVNDRETLAVDKQQIGSQHNENKPLHSTPSNSHSASVDGNGGKKEQYEQTTPSTSRAVPVKYDATVGKQSQTTDPYLFIESQSIGNIASTTLESKSKDFKRRPIRVMKKILHKRISSKSKNSKNESSTDECIDKTQQRRLALRGKRVTESSKIVSAESGSILTSSNKQFTVIQEKSDFHKPHNVSGPYIELGAKVIKEQSESEEKLKKNKGQSTSTIQNKKSKKLSVNFTDSHGSELQSDNVVIEVKRVIRTVKLQVIVEETVVMETLNRNRTPMDRRENSPVVISQRDLGVIDQTEQATERIIKCDMSPSSVTTGELADISSMSKSSSSVSAVVPPSCDQIPACQSSLLSAQRQNVPQQDSTPQQIKGENAIGDKNHWNSNHSGTDLLHTPNLTVIDHVDSQTGKMFASLNSSLSLPHISPITGSEPGVKDNSSAAASVPDELVQHQADTEHPTSAATEEDVGSNIRTRKRKNPSPQKIENKIMDNTSSQERGRKRKRQDRSDSMNEISKEASDPLAQAKSTQGQSTGFSIHENSGRSGQQSKKSGQTSKSSSEVSPQISLQGGVAVNKTMTFILSNYSSKPEIGAKVMAKWNDGFFYAGLLTKVDKVNLKYFVKFDDGSHRWTKACDIILAAELPVGQSVLVLRDSGFYEPGMIRGHSEAACSSNDQPQVLYHVDLDDGATQVCDRAKLILSEDQAACLLSDEDLRISPDVVTPSRIKPGEVSLDNIVDGKRQPRLTKSMSASKESKSSTSGPSAPVPGSEEDKAPSSKKKKVVQVLTSTPNSHSVRIETTPEKQIPARDIGGAVISPASEYRRSPRKVCKGLFDTKTKKMSNIFDGIKFILTHVEKSTQHRSDEKRLLQDSSLETSTDDSTSIVETGVPPFVKEHIQNLIINGGGTVLKSFDDVPANSKDKLYLVAAEHQRTFKYLQALALGVPIVSHQWILHSVSQNSQQPVEAYKLPAGISLEKKQIMEEQKWCRGLENLTTMVVSSNEEFTKSWTAILTSAGCNILQKLPTSASKYDPGVNVVITDSACPTSMVRKCERLNIPLVSTEWVIQCLINGHLMKYKGHEKYKHDFQPT